MARVQPVDDDIDGDLGAALGATTADSDAGDPGQEAAPSDLDANLPGAVVEEAHSPAAPGEARSTEEAAAPAPGGGKETTELAPDAESTTGADAVPEQMSKETGNAGGGGEGEWTPSKWFAGFQHHTLAEHMGSAFQKPMQDRSRSDFEWLKSLSDNPEEVRSRLDSKECREGLLALVMLHLNELKPQAFATGEEQNEKFASTSKDFMSYGTDKDFEEGLIGLLGFPHDSDTLGEMWREHCQYSYATETKIHTSNYGIDTSTIIEWQAVAGSWAPDSRKFALASTFVLPRETTNVKHDGERRITICVDSFFPATRPVETPGCLGEERDTVSLQDCYCCCCHGTLRDKARLLGKEGREVVVEARLTREEVVAVRLWTGPMYVEYNRVLRCMKSVKGGARQYTTTLHALCSATYKISHIGTPEVVYRGFHSRAITAQDFSAGAFVELGAQSFTRERRVAQTYSQDGGEDGAHYVYEVTEGHIDQGADISKLSFYPGEAEKFYRPLSMMQVIGNRIEGTTLVLTLRVNVNTKVSTLEELRQRKKLELTAKSQMLERETRESIAVKTAGDASRLGDLEMLKEELTSTDALEFNKLPRFVELNEKVLKTWQGVNYHSEAYCAIDKLLQRGDKTAAVEIRQTEQHLRQLHTALVRRLVTQRLQRVRLLLSAGIPLLRSILFHCSLLVAMVVSAVLGALLIPACFALRISQLFWLMQPCADRLEALFSYLFKSLATLRGPKMLLTPVWAVSIVAVVALRVVVGLFMNFPIGMLWKVLVKAQAYFTTQTLHAFVFLFGESPRAQRCIGVMLVPRQVIQKDMLLWRWARRDIRALQHVLDMLLPDSEADRMSDDELRRLIRDDQKRLRMLYKRGGVAAKEMYCDINCGSMKISQGLHRVLSKLASIDLAEGQRLNRLNDALECIRESCSKLPMSNRDSGAEITQEAREALLRFCVLSDLEEELNSISFVGSCGEDCVRLGIQGRHKCDVCEEWIERDGYRCSNGCDFDVCMKCAAASEGGEKQSVLRILELFEKWGSNPTCRVVQSFGLDSWDARSLGRLCVTADFLDGVINLKELMTGHLTELHLGSLSRAQAATLVCFVSAHSRCDIRVSIGDCQVAIVIGPKPREKHQVATEVRDGGDSLPQALRLFGLEEYLNTPRSKLHLRSKRLSLDMLRLLAEAAEQYPDVSQHLASTLIKVDMNDNVELGGDDGGKEAAYLIMRILTQIAPNVRGFFLPKCGCFGDAGAAVIAASLHKLPRLCQLNMLENQVGPEGIQALGHAWQSAGKARARLSLWHEDEGLAVDLISFGLKAYLPMLGDVFCGTRFCLFPRTYDAVGRDKSLSSGSGWWFACFRDKAWQPAHDSADRRTSSDSGDNETTEESEV